MSETTTEGNEEKRSATQKSWSSSLEEYVRGLAENTGAMADLRSGLNKAPEQCYRMHRWVARFVPNHLVNTGYEAAVYAVSSFAAYYPRSARTDRNLGWSLRQAQQTKGMSEQGMDARLIRLARSNSTADLCRNLRPLISLLRAAGTPVSWSQLAKDVGRWDKYSADVSRSWMRSFFQANATQDRDTNNSKRSQENL